MKRRIQIILISALVLLSLQGDCCADTFKHRETGQIFHGFATQKVLAGRTRIYNSDTERFTPVNLAEYDITADAKGRRNRVIVIQLKKPEILLSHAATQAVIKALIDASNKGPKFILIELDSPGGRGDYTKKLATAIIKTDNCPVIAFITGGKFAGTHSVAAALALACEKIYIAPGASISSQAPATGEMTTEQEITEFTNTYNADNLADYSGYIAALAEKNNRPDILARALLDRDIKVIEVTDRSRNVTFIDSVLKRPAHSLVRVWSTQDVTGIDDIYSDDTTPKKTQMRLTLSAKDAVYSKMADKIANSRTDILNDFEAGDAKLIRAGAIDSIIRKFIAARRNVTRLLASINDRQQNVRRLKKQFDEAEEQNRQNAVTEESREYYREQSKKGYTTAERRQLDFEERRLARKRVDEDFRNVQRRDRRRGGYGFEGQEGPAQIDTEEIRQELFFVLVDVISDYRKTISLATRYPGALPLDMTVKTLQNKLGSTEALYNEISR